MNASCPFERDVVKTGDPRQWPEALVEHVAGCDTCAAAAAVGPWMQQFAKTPVREHRLPDPAVVWLKAQLLKNTMAAERVGRPMTAVQIAAYVLVGGSWATLLMLKWDALQASRQAMLPNFGNAHPAERYRTVA